MMSVLTIEAQQAYKATFSDDYDALLASLHLCDFYQHNPVAIQDVCDSETSILFLGIMGGRAVSMATLIKPVNSIGNRTAMLEDVATQRNFMRQGIGSAMLTKLVEEATTYGATRIELHSNEVREQAHGLYKKFGFSTINTSVFRKML